MKILGKTAAEIFESVRTLIQNQAFPPGTSLPSVRDLAVDLGVNRNTVAVAYRRLVTSGIAVTQGRLGTIVRDQYAAGEQEGIRSGGPLMDLASGNPNRAWLPELNASMLIKPYEHRLYGEPIINTGLNEYIRTSFGPDCHAAFEVDLTYGAVDAIERLLTMDLRAGDKVAVESPCFLSSINLLRTFGLSAVGIAMDNEGMRPEALEEALAREARAVILTPRAQNPTGCSLSKERARALARVLEGYPNVLIIIDDHFALLSNADYHSVVPHNAQRWALVRSFAKVLGPDIRVAAVLSDATTSRQLRLRLAAGTGWVSHLLQDVVEVALTRPENMTLIAQARSDYAARRRALEEALQAHDIACLMPGDGLNLWIPLKIDDREVALLLAQQGWIVRHGDAFKVQEPVRGLRVSIGTLDPSECQQFALHVKQSLP